MKIAAIALLVLALPLYAQTPQDQGKSVAPTPDSSAATQFGYFDPAAALAALRQRPDVLISGQREWTVADDRVNFTLWTFTKAGNPAHPAGVKRVIVQGPTGDISVMMTAKCGAAKATCDKLIADFQALNDTMRKNVQSEIAGHAKSQ